MPVAVLRIEPIDHRDPGLAAQILALLALAYAQETRLLRPPPIAPLECSVDEIRAGAEFYLGARRDGQLFGTLALGADDEAGQIRITTLAVDPAHQRRGIARALLEEALRRSEGIVLSVATPAANAPALALYRGLGFVAYGQGTIGPDSLPLLKLRRAPGGRR